MAFTLTATNRTATSVTMVLSSSSGFSSGVRYRVKIFSDSGMTTQVANSGWKEPDSGATEIRMNFSGLSSGTYYAKAEDDSGIAGHGNIATSGAFVLGDTSPKTATYTQWSELATTVKNNTTAISNNTTAINTKVSITLSTTDIGEGVSLAANTLYGVYE